VKRTTGIVLIALASIVLGIFFNTYLISVPYDLFYSLTDRYLISIAVMLMVLYLGFSPYFLFGEKVNVLRKKRIAYYGYLILITLCLLFLKNRFFGETYINGLILSFIYPVAFLDLNDNFSKETGPVHNTLNFLILMFICWAASGYKMMLFTSALFIFAELYCIRQKDVSNKKSWYYNIIALIFLLISSFVAIMWFYEGFFTKRIVGFFNTNVVQEYVALHNLLKTSELFRFVPTSDFAEHINSLSACPYSNILSCFGIIPTACIMFLQGVMIVFMFLNAKEHKNQTRRFFSTVVTMIIGLHFVLSIMSSFSLIPMVEYGAPLITMNGTPFSIIPLTIYLGNEILEYNVIEKLRSKLRKNH